MSTVETHWIELFLHKSRFVSSSNIEDRGSFVVQWHTAASTLYIVQPDRSEIDIRIEREVFEILFQDPSTEAPSAVIALRMLFGRHLTWAEGTKFHPEYDDANQITIRLDSTDMAVYESLTQWLVRNVNAGAAKSLSLEQADALMDKVRKESGQVTLDLLDNSDEDTTCHDPTDLSLHSPYGMIWKPDLKRLQDNEWANDNIIQFGLNWIAAESRSRELNANFFVFSSFFFSKLRDRGVTHVLRWGKKENFSPFNHDFILIPVNDTMAHWFLVILDYPGLSVKRTNGKSGHPLAMPGIYILDSVISYQSGQSGRIFNTILRYLAAKAEADGLTFDKKNWKHINAAVPQQSNDCECGYYLLHFAEVFLSSPQILRANILAENFDRTLWGQPNEMRSRLRKYIHQTIAEISTE